MEEQKKKGGMKGSLLQHTLQHLKLLDLGFLVWVAASDLLGFRAISGIYLELIFPALFRSIHTLGSCVFF